MVKQLQLLSVVVPSLSVKVDDPQMLLQLANVHRHSSASTLDLHNSVQTMESRMESMVQMAIASGEPGTPSGTTPTLDSAAFDTMSAALDTIEGQLGTEKTSNDDDWKAAVNAVADCNVATKDAWKEKDVGVSARSGKKKIAMENHATCRSVEDTNRNDEFNKHRRMKRETDDAFKAKPDGNCEKHNNEDELLQDLTDAKKWAKDWEAKVDKSIKDYDAAVIVADGKAAACDKLQTGFEVLFCEYKVKLDTTCKDHYACVERTVAARNSMKTKLEDKERAEKIILKSCSKVRCYIKLLQKGSKVEQGDYTACKDGDKDTTELNINWIPIVEPERCFVKAGKIAPGSEEFNTNLYTPLAPKLEWMPGKEGIEATIDCTTHLDEGEDEVADDGEGEGEDEGEGEGEM